MFRLGSITNVHKAENKTEHKREKKGSITKFLPAVHVPHFGFGKKAAAHEAAKGGSAATGTDFEFANPNGATTPSRGSNLAGGGASSRGSNLTPGSLSRASSATQNSTTPMKQESFSNPRPAVPSLSLDPSGLPPALQNREENIPSRPPAGSMTNVLIDRFWHLGDVLEDKNVAMSWRLRVMMALDIAKELKAFHGQSVCHGSLSPDSVVVDQNGKCHVEDTGAMARTTDASKLQRDVLSFGTLLIQLALHQTLDLGGLKTRRSINVGANPDLPLGMPDESFQNIRRLFSQTIAGADVSDMADSLEFQETLATEIRALAGFKPKPSENISDDAILSLEELAVQCCSALAMNRPEADAVEDWLAAIVDMVGGQEVTADDFHECERVLWALQSNEAEILGDISMGKDSGAVTGKGISAGTEKDDDADEKNKDGGYETDDSFLPPQLQARRPSRLSMFIENNDKVAPLKDSQHSLKSAEEKVQENKKKRASSRMSIKPSAMNVEKFAGMHRRASSNSGLIITPAQCRARFDKQERLSKEEIMVLLAKAEEILRAEPNLPVVQAPVTVVGDIHGQYFDLANMVTIAGAAGAVKYLFLGDYVDRGDWSCEVLFYILSMKVAYPQHVTMIRGNHECDAVSSYFGFKEEVESKYGRPVFYRCLTLFQCMPVGAVLDTGGAGRFLCVHGGISPHVTSLEQFESINRFQEPGMNGFLCDVLWSDPIKDDFDDGQHAKSLGDFLSIDFVSNPARGCSFRYGYSAIVKFLATNRLVAIIRAHEVMQEGFRYHFQTITGGGKSQARIMPPVITVFSAPNYLGTYGNQGAFLRVSSAKDRGTQGGFKPIDLLEPIQFSAINPPAPRVLASESQMQKTTIETACPYMPTTFDTFVARVLDFALGEEDEDDELVEDSANIPQTLDEEGRSIFDMEGITQAPGMEHRRKESIEKEAKQLREGLNTDIKLDMQGADLLKGGLLLSTNRRLSLVALREKKGVSSLIAQFSKAAAADGINEMHPSLVQEKITQAKKKIDNDPKARDTSVSISKENGSETPVLGAGGAGGRRTVVANKRVTGVAKSEDGSLRKSVSAKNKGFQTKKSIPQIKQAPAITAEPASAPTRASGETRSSAPKEVEVDFSESEIVALQLLYLMIDRSGVGNIRSKELTQWSASDGATISESDAEICIEALDLDEDGGVGFTDYLAFAARLKLKHEKKNRLVLG